MLIAYSAPAAAQSPPYFAGGIRWIGAAPACIAPTNWGAQRVFTSTGLPLALSQLCLYVWRPTTPVPAPTPAQVAALFTGSGAIGLTEDVPVVFPGAPPSPEEQALFLGLRNALRGHVGTASLLPSMSSRPAARVVVIDSAPDATAGHIVPGASRHGDTLAHLIEDIVCTATVQGRVCAAEVTTALALPWIAPGVPGPNGGHVGTLSDLARAIERALITWQADRAARPTTPDQLVLNISLAWEHTPGIAECTTASLAALQPPARAVRGMLQHAAAAGALIIAAAGNDTGGPTPRTGLACPGRYQAVPRDHNPAQSLVLAVSGVDYRDRTLELTRPLGVTAVVALGLGGVAWKTGDPVPPQLTGTSVSTAVVSAIGALVWAHRPDLAARDVVAAIYGGGIDVGPADACPLGISRCRSRRASVCGALRAAGAVIACVPPLALPSSCPSLPSQVAALVAAFGGGPPSVGSVGPASDLPHDLAPSVQVDPWVFPAPIAATCPTCIVDAQAQSMPLLVIPGIGQDLTDAMLVVKLVAGPDMAMQLGAVTVAGGPYVFPLPAEWTVHSAYLTGFDKDLYSVTQQIFVEQ